MGFGMEILFVLVLGLLVLGPKRMHSMLAHVAAVKAQFENSASGFKSRLAAELADTDPVAGADSPREAVDE